MVSSSAFTCNLISHTLPPQVQFSEYGVLSRVDRMLLGVSSPPDTVDVEELTGQDRPFAVRPTLVQFKKRMKVLGEIVFEFIA